MFFAMRLPSLLSLLPLFLVELRLATAARQGKVTEDQRTGRHDSLEASPLPSPSDLVRQLQSDDGNLRDRTLPEARPPGPSPLP